ncbi:porin [Porticoccus sp. GXU_MW_L64]
MTPNTLLKLTTIAVTLSALPAANAEQANSVAELFTQGEFDLNFRYRYEYVDQQGIENTAKASTLKSRLSYKSATYNNFRLVGEVDNVSAIGAEQYRTPTNGNTQFPIVADPTGTDLNQLYVEHKSDLATTVIGRQRILIGSQRFVGGVGWRQNEQTYDALTVKAVEAGPVSLQYSYINAVNRIFGPDNSAVQPRRWNSNSHLIGATVKPIGNHQFQAFAYLLDFDNSPANSSNTFGIDYKTSLGKFTIGATLARQSNAGDNPVDYSANYFSGQLSYPLSNTTVSLGYERLGSDDGNAAFRTPLATLHKFQGWSDKFLGTPAGGIEDVYLQASTKLGSLKVLAAYHRFDSEEQNTDLGSELNLVATYAINDSLSAQLKYASYDADTFATDTDKVWLTLTATY